MLTSSLVALILREAKNWSSENIVDVINEVHRICLTAKPVGRMRMYDSTNGKDPTLTTVAGTYTYDIDIANGFDNDAWRVAVVYNESDGIGSPKDCICLDSDIDSAAQVQFQFDPGANDYLLRAYKQPTEILSTSIQLDIPQSFHLSHVYEGVMGHIEKADSGRSERWVNFMKTLLPEMQRQLSDYNKNIGGHVPRRGY